MSKKNIKNLLIGSIPKHLFDLILPSIYIGFFMWGFTGMLLGISIGQIFLGIISIKIGKNELSVCTI